MRACAFCGLSTVRVIVLCRSVLVLEGFQLSPFLCVFPLFLAVVVDRGSRRAVFPLTSHPLVLDSSDGAIAGASQQTD